MNSQALERFVDQMSELLKSGADFAAREAPGLFTEILHFRLAEAIILVLVAGFVLVADYFVHRHAQRELLEDRWSGWGPGYIGIVSVAVAALAVFLFNLIEAVQILVAPRIFLIEYFASLVRHK